MMFGSVLEHFGNLRLVKICKTCVSGLNALFRGTEIVKTVRKTASDSITAIVPDGSSSVCGHSDYVEKHDQTTAFESQ